MPTPNERKGLLFLAVVALSGTGVRVWRASVAPPTLAESAALDRHLRTVDSVRLAKRAAAMAPKPKQKAAAPAVADSQPIDINTATSGQIEALPGIGPALAKRIVNHRDSAGAFADLGALCEVRGVGPALAERLRPLVTFGGRSSPVSDACVSPSTGAGKARVERSRKRP